MGFAQIIILALQVFVVILLVTLFGILLKKFVGFLFDVQIKRLEKKAEKKDNE